MRVKATGKDQEVKFICDICELEFVHEIARGRPPAYCPACRLEQSKEKARLRQKKRQDKLRDQKKHQKLQEQYEKTKKKPNNSGGNE